jgi:hypothetical protein
VLVNSAVCLYWSMNVVQLYIGYHLLTFTPTCVMKVVVEGPDEVVLVFRRPIVERHHSRRFISDWFTDIS